MYKTKVKSKLSIIKKKRYKTFKDPCIFVLLTSGVQLQSWRPTRDTWSSGFPYIALH